MSSSLEDQISELVSHLDLINQLDESSITEDIIELKNNLLELIELKKEELLEFTKSILIKQCDAKINEELIQICEQDDIKIDDDIIGSVASIEFRFNNGCIGNRNIVIYDSVVDPNDSYSINYISFFSHPVYRSELPCNLFLNNLNCHYGDSCKYSHGSLVPSTELRSSINLDNTISEGDKCLVLISDDDVWRQCRVLHVDISENNNSCVVELIKSLHDKSDKVLNIDLNRLAKYPDSDFLEVNDHNEDKITEPIYSKTEIPFKHSNAKFGEWEKHTKGIGLKLLMKMGYKKNTGLGKDSQGRLLPIEIKQFGIIGKNTMNGRKNNLKITVPRRPIDHNSSESMKSTLVRNEGKLSLLRSKIESLERSKERHMSCRTLLGSANRKIDALKKKMEELNKADKLLSKKLDNTNSKKMKKLNIF